MLIFYKKNDHRAFIVPLTRSSLITKLHMLFTTMFAYCIRQKYLLPGSSLPGEVLSLGRWVEKTPNPCLHERLMLGKGTHMWITLGTSSIIVQTDR